MAVIVCNVRRFMGAGLYIGRAVPRSPDPRVRKGHPLANPLALAADATPEERAANLAEYGRWLRALPDLDAELHPVAEFLRRTGHPLLCWCDPLPCHGHVLAQVLKEKGLVR